AENTGGSTGEGDGETQQLGTDLQAGGPGRFVVDLEADLVVLGNEVDHASGLNEVVGFADGEDAGTLEPLNDFGEALLFRVADEKDVAVGGFGGGAKCLHGDRVSVDFFAGDRLFKLVAEGVVAEHSN